MDPITTSLVAFREQVRLFAKDASKTLLAIVTPSQHVGQLAKTLRAEEWYPGNRSPYIIVDTPWLDDNDDIAETVGYYIREHYALLVKGFEKDGIALPPFEAATSPAEEPLDLVAADLVTFTKNIATHCAPPFFCWLPSTCKNTPDFIDGMRYLLEQVQPSGIRQIITVEKEKRLKPLVKTLDSSFSIIRYDLPEAAMQEYAAKLFAPPAAGHAAGTPSGSAAPDVAPPARKIAPPSDDQVKESVEKLGLSPVLLPGQAEALRTALFAAALAAGRNDAATALTEQEKACAVCEEAGVKLEHCLMRLTLANYHLQFRQEEEAMREYAHAERIAAEIPSYTQLAQIRMAQAFVCMRKKKRLEEAIGYYEQAAAAATIGEVWLLYLECLRMLGTCHLKRKDPEAAASCWNAAVLRAPKMDTAEVAASTFIDIAARFISLLEKERLDEQAASVAAIVQEVGAQFAPEGSTAP
jgi:tetratricopeptide (TPR) repeat protein